jgi:hypothetical protein
VVQVGFLQRSSYRKLFTQTWENVYLIADVTRFDVPGAEQKEGDDQEGSITRFGALGSKGFG